jgi:DNA polymerase III alpha subunit (gram-positive type)
MADKQFDLVFVDVETTGLDPERDEIIELAAIRIDPMTHEEKGRFHAFFLPDSERIVPEEVRKINGYDREKWLDLGAKSIDEDFLKQTLFKILEGAAFAGQNPAFDRAFIQVEYRRFGIKMPPMDYHLIDVASLAWPLFMSAKIPGMSLRHTRTYFGMTGEQKHRALADVEDSIHVYKRLMDIYLDAVMGG